MSSDGRKIIQVQLSNIERNYRKLQSEYNWQPLSETIQQFREKCPLQFDDKASLIYRADRLNYIKSSQPKLAQDIIKPLKRYGRPNEVRPIMEPPEAYRFGQLCNKAADRPKNVIYTNAKGFARLLDPYVTTTMQDIVPQAYVNRDTVTFWNWSEREERKNIPKKINTTQPRTVYPVSKCKLHNEFSSETKAKFVKPVEMEFRLDPRIVHSIILDPTDRSEISTENAMYGGTMNCARVLKQRKDE